MSLEIPPVNPRRKFDSYIDTGYLESDDDYFSNNKAFINWCLDNEVLIRRKFTNDIQYTK